MESSPKYRENQKKVFKWYEKMENHFSNHKWETIPNEAMKRLLFACITGSARQEIGLLQD